MIHPYFNLTGEEAKGLLYGLLEVNKFQLSKDPSMPSMRKLIAEGKVKYRLADPNEHWQSYREIVEQVRENGTGYADCEDLAPAVAAEDSVRYGVESKPYAYKPKEGLFHVVVARPVPSRFSGNSFPAAMGAPPLSGYTTEDPSAAAGMLSSAVFGGVRGKPEGHMRDGNNSQYGGLGDEARKIGRSFKRGVTGGPISGSAIGESIGDQLREELGIGSGWAKNLGSRLMGPILEQAGLPMGGADEAADADEEEEDDLLEEEYGAGIDIGGMAAKAGNIIFRSFIEASTQSGFNAMAKAAGGEQRLARAHNRYKKTGDSSDLDKIRKRARRIQKSQVDWDEINMLIEEEPGGSGGRGRHRRRRRSEDEGYEGLGAESARERVARWEARFNGGSRGSNGSDYGFIANRTMLEAIAESLRRKIGLMPPGPSRAGMEAELEAMETELDDYVEGATELPYPPEAYMPELDDELSRYEAALDHDVIGTDVAYGEDDDDYGFVFLSTGIAVAAIAASAGGGAAGAHSAGRGKERKRREHKILRLQKRLTKAERDDDDEKAARLRRQIKRANKGLRKHRSKPKRDTKRATKKTGGWFKRAGKNVGGAFKKKERHGGLDPFITSEALGVQSSGIHRADFFDDEYGAPSIEKCQERLSRVQQRMARVQKRAAKGSPRAKQLVAKVRQRLAKVQARCARLQQNASYGAVSSQESASIFGRLASIDRMLAKMEPSSDGYGADPHITSEALGRANTFSRADLFDSVEAETALDEDDLFDIMEENAEFGLDDDDEYGSDLMDSNYSTGIYKHLVRVPVESLTYPMTDDEEDAVAESIVEEHFGFGPATNWDEMMKTASEAQPQARGWDVPGQQLNTPPPRSVRQISKPVISADTPLHSAPVPLSGYGLVSATDLDIESGFADWIEGAL